MVVLLVNTWCHLLKVPSLFFWGRISLCSSKLIWLALTYWSPRLALSFWLFCFYLLSAGITTLHYHGPTTPILLLGTENNNRSPPFLSQIQQVDILNVCPKVLPPSNNIVSHKLKKKKSALETNSEKFSGREPYTVNIAMCVIPFHQLCQSNTTVQSRAAVYFWSGIPP